MSIRRVVTAFAARHVPPATLSRHLLGSVALLGFMMVVAWFVIAQVTPIDTIACGDRWRYDSSCDPVPWHLFALTDFFAVFALAIALLVIAPATVAAQLAAERRQGTLEQLRSTPSSALALVLGLLAGAPARIYALAAAPLAFHVVYGALGGLSPWVLFTSVGVLFLGCFLFSLIAAAAALVPRMSDASSMQALSIGALFGISGFIALMGACSIEREAIGWLRLHPVGALFTVLNLDDGIFRHLLVSGWRFEQLSEPGILATIALAPVYFAVIALPAIAIFLGATQRRVHNPERPLFSKLQAILLFSLAMAAIVSPFPVREVHHSEAIFATLGFGFALLPILVAVGTFATPTRELWAIGVVRRQSSFADSGSPAAAMTIMIGLFLATMGVRWGFAGEQALQVATIWGLYLALTASTFLLFRATSVSSGGLFLLGYGTYLFIEIIAVGVVAGRSETALAHVYVTVAGMIGVGVPAYLAFRLRSLRRQILAA